MMNYIFRELMEVFPDAKVVLSVRNPETWYESVKNTIYQFHRRDFAISMFQKLTFSNIKAIDRIDNYVPDGMDKGEDKQRSSNIAFPH